MTQQSDEKGYFCKITLRKTYGLTPSMIEELGPPDLLCDNQHCPSGPPACLYSIQRVEAWVEANRERLDRVRATRINRSESMKAVHRKKRAERREEAMKWIRGVAIIVCTPFPNELLERARKYNKFIEAKGLRSFVRHRLTNYHALLKEVNESEFSDELYTILRQRDRRQLFLPFSDN